MNKAEKVRTNRLIAIRHRELFHEVTQKTDEIIKKIFDVILDTIQKNTEEYVLTDIFIFCEKTFDVKEYSIHKDGFYHYDEKIIDFGKEVNVERMMNKLQYYIEKHDGYRATQQPYQHYYNEPLTFYLQVSVR